MDTPQQKPCTKCKRMKRIDEFSRHKRNKDGREFWCKDCKRAYKKGWSIINADRLRVQNAAYQLEHREEHVAWQKQYDEAHKEEKKARSKRSYETRKAQGILWCQLDRASAAAKSRKYYAEHPEEIRAYRLANRAKRAAQARAWHAAHPNANREQCQRRLARLNGAAIVDLSPAQWQEILIVFNYRCAYCPDNCKACKNKTHALQQEHIEPVVKGGNYTVHNIVPACEDCNRRKHAGPPPVPVQPLLLTLAPAKKPKKRSG